MRAASNCDGFTGMRSMILTDKIVGGRNSRAKRAAALAETAKIMPIFWASIEIGWDERSA